MLGRLRPSLEVAFCVIRLSLSLAYSLSMIGTPNEVPCHDNAMIVVPLENASSSFCRL